MTQWTSLIIAAIGFLGGGGFLTFLSARGQQAAAREKDSRQRAHQYEDYAGRLRDQLKKANITPEEWPDDHE